MLRRWRRLAEEYDPPRLLLGETYVAGSARLARFYGDGDELQLAFNFPFLRSPFHAEPLRQFVDDTEAALPAGAWPVWTGSNHDHSRFPTRWAQNDDRRIRLGLLMLLTIRGTPVLYYGDEIGMPDTPMIRSPAPGPGGHPQLAGAGGPGPRADADALDGRGGCRLHDRGGPRRGCPIGDNDAVNVDGAAGRSRVGALLLPEPAGAPARARRPTPGRVRARWTRPTVSWVFPRGAAPPWR